MSYYHIHTHLVRKLRNRLTILLHRWVSVEIHIFHDATKLMVDFSWALCGWKILLLRLSSTPLLLWWRSEFRPLELKIHPAMKHNGKKGECLQNSTPHCLLVSLWSLVNPSETQKKMPKNCLNLSQTLPIPRSKP